MSIRDAVGIDDINLYSGPLTISYEAIAHERGLTDREREHAQFVRRSVVPPFEDPVTIAVNAADPLVKAAGADSFGMLLVATETPLDYAVPVSSHIHKALGLPTTCRHVEMKNACYAGASALQLAAAWIRSGMARGRRALVITTDLSGRRAHHPSEMTSGEGAIALVVSTDPKVLVLDPFEGCAADDVHDIRRPRMLQETGNPMGSLSAYLDMLDLAWEAYRAQAGAVRFEEQFRYMAFHTPLVWLVRQAHQTLLQGDHPDVSDEDVAASFDRMVGASLSYPRLVGNIYSGCVLLALTGVLDALQDADTGERIGIFSYGSGASAEFLSGVVAPGARCAMATRGVGAALAARREVTVGEMDAASSAVYESLTSSAFVPDRTASAWRYQELYEGQGRLVLDRVQDYFRHYARS
jgi:3-hydroxy-3-methylglutaryl CoA synthase